MSITTRPRWSLGRGNRVVPSRWQATHMQLPTSLIVRGTTAPPSQTKEARARDRQVSDKR